MERNPSFTSCLFLSTRYLLLCSATPRDDMLLLSLVCKWPSVVGRIIVYAHQSM